VHTARNTCAKNAAAAVYRVWRVYKRVSRAGAFCNRPLSRTYITEVVTYVYIYISCTNSPLHSFVQYYVLYIIITTSACVRVVFSIGPNDYIIFLHGHHPLGCLWTVRSSPSSSLAGFLFGCYNTPHYYITIHAFIYRYMVCAIYARASCK